MPAGALTVTLTIADLLTAPPVALDPRKGAEFRGLMARAVVLLGARATPDAGRYAFRIEEHRNDGLFAVAFTTGAHRRHLIIDVQRADELGRLLEAAVNLMAAAATAAASDYCVSLNSPPA